ncbi:hypothetical protein [Hydrogenispora ethanolica]|uniref:hypothetical protein n=1 Tax=Hydrogenispora ethanolica TaxID=1082276 RepID=UPI0010518455|nr:hypothetical protein [Hydrogenispora ethanolica]
MNFKIPPDTHLPKLSGACSSGLVIPILSFIDKDFWEIELYMSYSDEDKSNNDKNNLDLLRLSRFILQEGSKGYDKDEYEFELLIR